MAGLAGGRITALRSLVLSMAGDIFSWIRRLTWQPGSGGLGCWDLGAGACGHSAAGHRGGVTQGRCSDEEPGRQQWSKVAAHRLLPDHLNELVNPLPVAVVKQTTQDLCYSSAVAVQEFNWHLHAHSPISKERSGIPAYEARSAASLAGRACCRQVFVHASGACA